MQLSSQESFLTLEMCTPTSNAATKHPADFEVRGKPEKALGSLKPGPTPEVVVHRIHLSIEITSPLLGGSILVSSSEKA